MSNLSSKSTINSISENFNNHDRGKKSQEVIGTDYLSIMLASPEDVLSWSSGEIKKSETVSYRTYKPESDGLFSAKIFGPTRDYECQCGKYRRIKYKGIVCEKCGVEVTTSRVRRQRLGHIVLVAPVAHILFLRGTSSPIGTALGISAKDAERVLYFDSHMVTDPGNTTLARGQVLSDLELEDCLKKFGQSFSYDAGAGAIKEVLSKIDLNQEVGMLRTALTQTKSDIKRRNILKRIRFMSEFSLSGNKLEWMIVTKIPVLPPDLRPLVQLDGGRFVSSDLNELYRRVINRNERLKKMIIAKAPDIIIRNEKRMLQEVVDALFDNSKKVVSAKSSTGKQLKSLSEYLKGKQGRFRQNLLGKRVDYSGRSVIVVGPSLRLHQCGLPKLMALELYKPFIFSKLLLTGKVNSVKIAKKMIESQSPEVWEVLEEVVREKLVLLNRAPTLHRLNIQAFEPKLIESKAIQLHPLVCKAFNADFDGDQMAVHVPLSIEAQIETRVLLMSSNNVLSPQNGQPVIVPTKDIVVGLYYITLPIEDAKGSGSIFNDYSDVLRAMEFGVIAVNAPIRYIVDNNTYNTTPGRIMLYSLLPGDGIMSFEQLNIVINNKTISSLMTDVYIAYGQKNVVVFADKITAIGFKYSTKSGLSFGKDDMIVPQTKSGHIAETMKKIKIAEDQYLAGYITHKEKYNQVTDRWSECTDRIAKDMMIELSRGKNSSSVNSIYVMMNSGARVSETLMRQIAGMRGLITKPSGEVIETPIMSNFKEGLSVLEYFNSAHGARKGAADTALKTADAGYLTRRLVDVSQDCTITDIDCGSEGSIHYNSGVANGESFSDWFFDVAFGRVLARDLLDLGGNIIVPKNTIISESHKNLDFKESSKIQRTVYLRSPVTCTASEGICAMCYGRDLATGQLVNVGEAVGIIAAQSIGEPGAQLTMRTFHIGGAVSRSVEKSSVDAEVAGLIKFIDLDCVGKIGQAANKISVSNAGIIAIVDKNTREEIKRYTIPYAATVKAVDGASVEVGSNLAQWDPYNDYIVSAYSGTVSFADMVLGLSFREKIEDEANRSSKIITDWTSRAKSLSPRIFIKDENGINIKSASGIGEAKYILPIDSIVMVNDGDSVVAGQFIARIPKESIRAVKDITGGLPRVEDIFEARSPKEPAIIAEISGIANFVDDYRSKNHLIIKAEGDDSVSIGYNIPRGKKMRVHDGMFVKKGDVIVDGDLNPHDILSVKGIDALTNFVVEEVQQVYKLQGVKIDNKHIEVIVRYMLQKVEITDPGEVEYISTHQQLDITRINKMNTATELLGKKPAQYKRVLQGITRASIQTDSFISAASFQETSKVLTEAAMSGKIDPLVGIKESVIVGKLIPAGTGYVVGKFLKEMSTIK